MVAPSSPRNLVLKPSIRRLYVLLASILFAVFLHAADEPRLFAQPNPQRHHSKNKRSGGNIAVFYNVFVPPEADEVRRRKAKSIIDEQLRQLADSDVVKSNNNETSLKLYFVSIGANETSAMVLEQCQALGLQSQPLNHYAKGFESQTLVHLHPHCRKNQDDQIIYMHNKGSLHQEELDGPLYGGQDNWRRAMTHAATSQACRAAIVGGDDAFCDVCGLMFMPLPYQHFPGNIWTTSCRYIRQRLYTWKVLQQRRTKMFNKLLREKRYVPAFYEPSAAMIGANRFLAEYWIGSHPRMRPCDVAKVTSLAYWKQANRVPNASAAEEFALRAAPRLPFNDSSWEFYRIATRPGILQDKQARLKDFFLLRGNLYKWKEIYRDTPGYDSWVWSWYPDGDEIKKQYYK